MEFPKRKPNRLKCYDYSRKGAYFITLCTKDRIPILSRITIEANPPSVGASIARPSAPELSAIGKTAEEAIHKIPIHYPNVTIDNYVIMPNHIHLLIRIDSGDGKAMSTPAASTGNGGRAMLAPTVSEVIRQMKGYVTKQCGMAIWQKSFHDHIIRDELDYQTRWVYIEENPIHWCEDEFYCIAE